MLQQPEQLYNRYLNRRGYVVRKNAISDAQLNKIRKDLLVTPYNAVKMTLKTYNSSDDSDSFKVYQENENKLYLPRYYAEKIFGKAEHDELCQAGDNSSKLVFHGSLREQQHEVAANTVQHLNEKGGGILQLRCGFGKTIIALYLVSQLQMKTIVLVHKEFLMNQWKERIEEFLPFAKVGTLQAKTIDVENKDIVIGMLQSVATGKYEKEVLQPFGFAIFDECHHLGAAVFSKAMGLARTRYMLGLSATPDRKDRLRKVFDWQFGSVICKVESKVTQRVDVKTVSFDDPDVTTDDVIIIKLNGERSVLYKDAPSFRCKVLEHVVTSSYRQKLLLDLVLEYAQNPDRRILVLSERRNHLTALGNSLEEHQIEHGFYWGNVKQAALDDAATKQVVLGTYHMASEGMDIPVLNTVILASPKSDIRQSVGRILRRTDHPIIPTVIDIVDHRIPCFFNQRRPRETFYQKCGFNTDTFFFGSKQKQKSDIQKKYTFRD